MPKFSQTIIITGASSGLGRALANEYAKNGVQLFLIARNESRLLLVQEECLKAGALSVNIFSANVKDQNLMNKIITHISQNHCIDILINCAGVSAGTLGGIESAEQINEIFATNLNGTLNCVLPATEAMLKQHGGKIVMIGSMAGVLPLSSAPAYSASKAAVACYANSLRPKLKNHNIQICLVIPGFIKTPMTAVNNFPMPFMISPQLAAKKIIRGINKNCGIITFPRISYYVLKILNLMHYKLLDYINRKLPGKPSLPPASSKP